MRETSNDLAMEKEILDAVCFKWHCGWRKLGNGGKYRVDAVLQEGPEIRAWVEVKDYSSPKFIGMNIPKYMEGVALAKVTGCTFMLLIRVAGRIGYIRLHDGLDTLAPPKFIVTGGTPAGKTPLPDDIEPMAMFDQTVVRWMD